MTTPKDTPKGLAIDTGFPFGTVTIKEILRLYALHLSKPMSEVFEFYTAEYAEQAINEYVEEEKRKIQVKCAAELSVLDQEIMSLKAKRTEYIKEIIGEDEVPATQEFGLDPEEVFMPSDIIRDVRNDLRAEQRKRLEM